MNGPKSDAETAVLQKFTKRPSRFRLPWTLCMVLCPILFTGILWLLTTTAAADVEPSSVEPSPPTFDQISQAVLSYFQSLPDYEPNDLISQSNVQEALRQVEAVGWEISDSQAIVEMALADGSFLVGQLSTSKGKKFMRKVAQNSGGYSRLDRLSSISRGQKLVRDLIRTRGGSDLIEYLATTKEGKHLGKMMAGAKQGVDLNKPTDRIYTEAQLLSILKTIYAQQAASHSESQ